MEKMVRQSGRVLPEFWQGKKVYLTGHTGFKGSWMAIWLHKMGAEIYGYALEPPTTPSLFIEAKLKNLIHSEIGDIRDYEKLAGSMQQFNPDILIHMAAQPLVRLSYLQPVETYSTNVMGTVHVLEAARACSNLKAIVSVTTDKCYENKEWVWGYREDEPMGGHDPYSASKACAELATSAYRRSFLSQCGIALASARAGNVVGGGDWAADRLIPDILRAFEKKQAVAIRNPLSTRPWQHVLEPLAGYLVLAQHLYTYGESYAEAWNFGPSDDAQSVQWIAEHMVAEWGNGVYWKLDGERHPHEAKYLKLDCSKAASRLGWRPKWKLEETLALIIDWHLEWLKGNDMAKKCFEEIEYYQQS